MSDFRIVNSIADINLSASWVDSPAFNDKDKIVDESGKLYAAGYEGSRYRLIAEKERRFSCLERIGRVFLAALIVVLSLGCAWRSKSIRRLFTEKKETIQYGVFVDWEAENKISEAELQEGIDVSDETIAKLQKCIRSIVRTKIHKEDRVKLAEEEGIKFHASNDNGCVFELDIAPGLIFKTGLTSDRYNAMINGRTICRIHELGLLVIPNAKKLAIAAQIPEYGVSHTYTVIVEKKLDVDPQKSMQEKYFEEYAESLNKVIRQFAWFICKMGYDVKWENNPVVNKSLDANGDRKLALFDLDLRGSPGDGLFGCGQNRVGLVRCVNEEQGNIVAEVAKENGVSVLSFAQVHGWRKEELEDARKLKEHYATKNIKTGLEPIEVDLDSLDLNLTETAQVKTADGQHEIITFKKFAESVLTEINDKIKNSDDQATIKGRRYFALDLEYRPVHHYENKWLPRLIDVLIKGGHLFKSYDSNDEDYIQA